MFCIFSVFLLTFLGSKLEVLFGYVNISHSLAMSPLFYFCSIIE